MASRALFQPPIWRHHGELVLDSMPQPGHTLPGCGAIETARRRPRCGAWPGYEAPALCSLAMSRDLRRAGLSHLSGMTRFHEGVYPAHVADALFGQVLGGPRHQALSKVKRLLLCPQCIQVYPMAGGDYIRRRGSNCSDSVCWYRSPWGSGGTLAPCMIEKGVADRLSHGLENSGEAWSPRPLALRARTVAWASSPHLQRWATVTDPV